jgi:hypothetical protein
LNKLIISALLIFGLVGMIGTAVANPTSTTITGFVVDASGNQVEDAEVTVYEGDVFSGRQLGDTFVSGSIPGSEPGYYAIQVSTVDLTADITVYAVHHNSGSGSVKTTAGATNTHRVNVVQDIPIPEFPTIALPIAAILGLMFIISSRKKKE